MCIYIHKQAAMQQSSTYSIGTTLIPLTAQALIQKDSQKIISDLPDFITASVVFDGNFCQSTLQGPDPDEWHHFNT